MVMKYVIMCDSWNRQPFKTPRQLIKINGEPLVSRTIRLLKENGVEDILITAHDKRFDNLGATRYVPKHNDYDGKKREGYWLNAFTRELLVEPICFLFGDVYYSENAIKKIVKTETDSTLFFCTYKNKSKKYIKPHDEPLAYKVIDCELFKQHINIVKKMFDEGKTVRHPIVWELYRNINGQDINVHKMTTNYVAINDESCDIDEISDIISLQEKLGGKNMIKCEVVKEFTLARFNDLKNIERRGLDQVGRLFVGDTFECTKAMADYLMGDNASNEVVVKVIEVVPEKQEPEIDITENEFILRQPTIEAIEKPKAKKTTKKKTSKK